jgi:hypothetical protein
MLIAIIGMGAPHGSGFVRVMGVPANDVLNGDPDSHALVFGRRSGCGDRSLTTITMLGGRRRWM